MRLSIIIVNYNVKFFLEQCLCSVLRAVKNIPTEIIVVDNNSNDGSKAFFQGRFERVRFIWSSDNSGYAKANNLALQQATGDYVLFLNPDTIISEDSLEICLDLLETDLQLGAAGIHMIDGSGQFLKESKRGFPSPLVSLLKLSGITALFPKSKQLARYYLGHLDEKKNHEVDILSGAFMMVKKSVLNQTGGFDEQFFMYGEDIDLSYSIQKAGYKNIYISESTIIHFKGESTMSGSLNHVHNFYRAMSLFVQKHYNKGIARFYTLLIHFAIWTKAILSVAGHFIQRVTQQPVNLPYKEKCYVVANKDQYLLILAQLQKIQIPRENILWIHPGKEVEKGAAGNILQLVNLVDRLKIKVIIFCPNSLPVIEIVRLMQLLPSGLSFRFHFQGTGGIIGSSSKDRTRHFLSFEKGGI